jgi:serpin B
VARTKEARSSKRRLKPTVPAEAVAARADGELDLALDLLRALPRNGNLFMSPHSLTQVLALTFAGACAETAEEMARVLRMDREGHAAQNALDKAVTSRGKGARGYGGEVFRLSSVQAAWVQEGAPFEAPFLDLLAKHYGACAHTVDFAAARAACRAINAWICKATERRVPALLWEHEVTTDQRLVLTNAVFFSAAWEREFYSWSTSPRSFTLVGGAKVKVPTMCQSEHLPMASLDGVRAVELTYSGGEVSMLVLVPTRGTLMKLERELTAERLRAIVCALSTDDTIDLALPRFSIHSRLDLLAPLQQLGLRRATTLGQADFSGMDGSRELFLGPVIQEAMVEVDEQGTVAAAATGMRVRAGMSARPPVPFKVDRPFLFVIRDDATGAALFIGRVVDPR